MLHNPLHSRIAGVLPAGDGATPPPVASKAAVRPPRTAAHFTPRFPVAVPSAEDEGESPSEATRRRERRLRHERAIHLDRPFSEAEMAAIEAELRAPGKITHLEPARDIWPEPGGDSFRALSDREWEPVDDDRLGPVFVGTIALLTTVVLVLTGVAFARLVIVFL